MRAHDLRETKGSDSNLELGIHLIGEHTNQILVRDVNSGVVSTSFPTESGMRLAFLSSELTNSLNGLQE